MWVRTFLLSLALIATAQAGPQKIAYSKGSIYTAQLDGTKARKLVQGAWPEISPDGTRVVFNTEEENAPERHIGVVEIATGKRTIFKDIPSDNCHSPVWSPDGKQIAFYLFGDNNWHLGLINAGGTGFRYVRKAKTDTDTLWAAAWATDGKSFFCHTLDDLYRIDLDGKVIKQWSLAKLFPGAGLNSGSRLAPSPDGRTLLIDVDMGEDIPRGDWDGPPPAIWQLDLISGKATQVTKTTLFAWHPAWINDHEILCNHLPEGSKTISVYRLDLKTGEPKLVVKNATDASVSD